MNVQNLALSVRQESRVLHGLAEGAAQCFHAIRRHVRGSQERPPNGEVDLEQFENSARLVGPGIFGQERRVRKVRIPLRAGLGDDDRARVALSLSSGFPRQTLAHTSTAVAPATAARVNLARVERPRRFVVRAPPISARSIRSPATRDQPATKATTCS